ncbi:MAG TPA: chemotaxis response regulator protein-glutamate methylesterase [Gammaproteobacteria bacterium]|nr:chemotaxis response regulator protein-glutamate methylesterase [Gammaproteobacteria bacterium]
MTVKVLIVDDSAFFRRRIQQILEADSHIEVAGTAANGREAVECVARLHPDVVTMDIEMPVMDGISAVREIMASHPTPVLMFSSLTTEGARATLDALEAGAVDFLPKRMEDIANDRELAKRQLCARVRILGVRGLQGARPAVATRAAVQSGAGRSRPSAIVQQAPSRGAQGEAGSLPACDLRRYRLLLIGTSTGGPAALQDVLSSLPGDFPLPIVLVQHMPASFTPPFAQRLDTQCRIHVKHAEDGDVLRPATAYLAPGGSQLLLEGGGSLRLRVVAAEPHQTYKPSVDVTFTSAAQAVHGRMLALILTGMGADGREGARLLKSKGSTIWAQDEASCVVAGMPSAVIEAGIADAVLPLNRIGPALAGGCR